MTTEPMMTDDDTDSRSLFRCETCGATTNKKGEPFADWSAMRKHMTVHQDWTCPRCNKVMSITALGRHSTICAERPLPDANDLLTCECGCTDIKTHRWAQHLQSGVHLNWIRRLEQQAHVQRRAIATKTPTIQEATIFTTDDERINFAASVLFPEDVAFSFKTFEAFLGWRHITTQLMQAARGENGDQEA